MRGFSSSVSGGWAVLRNWNQNTFDHQNVLKKLHATYRVEPFFSIRVVPDDKNPGSTIVKIGPAKLSLPDKSYYTRSPDDPMVLAFERFVEDTVREFGASGPDAKAFAENMFHLEKRIAMFTPDLQDSENPVTTYNRISLKSLKTIAGSVPWLEIVREVYPDAEVSQTTPVLIVSKQYVQDVSQLFYANDQHKKCGHRGYVIEDGKVVKCELHPHFRALNNFLMWKLAEAMVPFLSSHFRAIYDLYAVAVSGARKPFERWEVCANVLEQNFGFAVGALSWDRTLNREEIINTVEEMFHRMRKEFIRHVEDNDLLSDEMKARNIEKIETMKLIVGYPERMVQSEYLNAMYEKMTVQRGAFYRNILYGAYFRRMTEQQALRSTDQDYVWRDVLLADQPSYVHQSNVLVVPPHVLRAPFFNRKFPRSFNYGSVGTLIGKAMMSALDEIGVHYSPDGLLDPILKIDVNASVIDDFEPSPLRATSNHLVVPRECLRKAFMELELGNANEVARAVNCSSVDIAGVRLALRALEASFEDADEPPQPGLPYFPQGIFFLSYSQMFCGEVRENQEEIDLISSRCFSPKTRLRAALTQLDEFGDAFECDGGDWSSSTRKQQGRLSSPSEKRLTDSQSKRP
ncbi:unnamed protein product [Notodromas monacha]|uniref:Uncharacterized protein n=1 Tax=Notodromas monacha TaxID=399045 RepID=A0A7R9GCX9_9CRUS|nr:unnamed protein product [Notodromas monacha]CAG0917947.1 unnamed protein product [Notodromas monacha]